MDTMGYFVFCVHFVGRFWTGFVARANFDLLQAQAARQTTNFQQRILTVEREAVKRIEELNRQTTAFTNRYQNQQAEFQNPRQSGAPRTLRSRSPAMTSQTMAILTLLTDNLGRRRHDETDDAEGLHPPL